VIDVSMKRDVYNLVTVNDGKADNAAIVKVFCGNGGRTKKMCLQASKLL